MIRALSEVFLLLLLLFAVFVVVAATFASTFISHNFQLTTADGTWHMANGKWQMGKGKGECGKQSSSRGQRKVSLRLNTLYEGSKCVESLATRIETT